MKEQAMTLQQIQQILDDQNRDLLAAHRVLTDQSAGRAVALPHRALERLRDMCSAAPVLSRPAKPVNGIPC